MNKYLFLRSLIEIDVDEGVPGGSMYSAEMKDPALANGS